MRTRYMRKADTGQVTVNVLFSSLSINFASVVNVEKVVHEMVHTWYLVHEEGRPSPSNMLVTLLYLK